jgi:hypothetical protein
MPYNNISEVPDYVPEDKRPQWMAVWNSSREKALKDRKTPKEAEEIAFRNANGVVKKDMEEFIEELRKMIEIMEVGKKEDDNKQTGDIYTDKAGIEKEINFKVIKATDEKLLYLVASQADVEDEDEDIITLAELKKAAYGYMKNSRKTDLNHNWQENGEVVESFIFDNEIIKAVKDGVIEENSWVIGIEPKDPGLLEAAEKGEVIGASIAGFGKRRPVE